MQVSNTTPFSDISREVVQASLIKKQIKAEGAQQQQLIESSLVEQPAKDPHSKVGVYLNVQA